MLETLRGNKEESMKGRLEGVFKDYKSECWVLQLAVPAAPAELESLTDKDVRIDIKAWHEKRTKNANALYWELIGKLAKVLGWSNARAHNHMLQQYGTPEYIDGQTVCTWLPDTEEAAHKVMEATTYHLTPTSETKGKERMYMMMKGSSRYDKAEFSRLINGLVDECQELDIPTESPDEIAHMMDLYKGAC